jgi:hypothetical protein
LKALRPGPAENDVALSKLSCRVMEMVMMIQCRYCYAITNCWLSQAELSSERAVIPLSDAHLCDFDITPDSSTSWLYYNSIIYSSHAFPP